MPELRRPVRNRLAKSYLRILRPRSSALRDEPILGFQADEFHRTVLPKLPFSVSGAAQSDAGRGTRASPECSLFSQA